jgi:hypothetical protein
MGKDTKILLAISLTALICAVLFIVFIRSTTKKEENEQVLIETKLRGFEPDKLAPKPTSSPEGKSETGAVSKVAIGSREVSNGTFRKVENGILFYKIEETVFSVSLNETEVVLACTEQNLDNVDKLDYDQISEVFVYSSLEIADNIQNDTSIVVFAEEMEDGKFKVHTIALNTSDCKK